jgi:hypothetical protein
MSTRPAEVALWKLHGLRVFYVADKKDLSTWDNLVRLVRRWDDIERTLAQRGAGPWLTKVYESRVRDAVLR